MSRTARAILRFLAAHLLIASLLALLAAMLVYPIVLTVRAGFAVDLAKGEGFTLEHIALTFRDPTLVAGLLNSLAIAAATTTLCLLIALPLSVLAARYRFPGKTVFNAAILVPMILPPFVGAIGMRAILGRAGALNALLGTDFDILGQARFWGIVVVEALHLYPIIYLNTTAALANLDPALDEAGENLGAGPVRRFLRITLPLVRPGIFAGGTIVFIWSFTELGTPLMFDYYRATPVQIFLGLREMQNSPRPYALTIVLLAVSIAAYVLGRLIFGRRGHAMYAKASRASGERPLAGPAGLGAAAFFGAVTFLAILPHLGVVLTSLSRPGAWYATVLPTAFTTDHFDEALTSPDSFRAIANSLFYSTLAMGLDLVLGLLIAYTLVRTRALGRSALDALSMLPLAVPGLVMAFGFAAMTLRWPFTEGAPLHGLVSVFGAAPSPVALLVAAYAVRRLPYIVRSCVAGLEQTSGELEEAAMSLGATRARAVRSVTVPLIAANLIAGGLLVFSFSMLEVSDSLILAQRLEHAPITKAIWDFSNRLGDGMYIASAMGVWGMALLTATLVGASLMLGKRLGAIFRA